MRVFERIAASAGVVMMAATASMAAVAQEMDVSVETRLRGTVDYLSFSHDASRVFPALGDPTSILEYVPLYSLGAEIALTGRSPVMDGPWFDLFASLPLASDGTFRDRDYAAGQVLTVETYSDGAMPFAFDLTGRVPMPGVSAFVSGESTIRPYLVASGGARRLTARGLRCGAICPGVADMPDTVTVIDHDVWSVEGGGGIWAEMRLSETQRLDLRAELRGGYSHVADSHYFRVLPGPGSLGPVPNIVYDFGTVGVYSDLTYTHTVKPGVDLSASLFGGVQAGFGQVVFSASTANPVAPLPAYSLGLSGGVSVGASVSF